MPQQRKSSQRRAIARSPRIIDAANSAHRSQPAATSTRRASTTLDRIKSAATVVALCLTVALVALPMVATIAARNKTPAPQPVAALIMPGSLATAILRAPIEKPEQPVVEVALIRPERPIASERQGELQPTRTPGAAPGFVPPIIHDYAELRREHFRKKVSFNPGISDECTPQALLDVIYDIAEMYGTVRIHSTFRDPKRNARVGGVQSSLHLECRAIDFSVPGHPRSLLEFLKLQPEIGGFSRYPFGHFHIDNGPRRQW